MFIDRTDLPVGNRIQYRLARPANQAGVCRDRVELQGRTSRHQGMLHGVYGERGYGRIDSAKEDEITRSVKSLADKSIAKIKLDGVIDQFTEGTGEFKICLKRFTQEHLNTWGFDTFNRAE
ncbi:hypothetical protein D3C79_808430 [compost metagenome]